jgi:hypothetical protein
MPPISSVIFKPHVAQLQYLQFMPEEQSFQLFSVSMLLTCTGPKLIVRHNEKKIETLLDRNWSEIRQQLETNKAAQHPAGKQVNNKIDKNWL